MSYDEVMKEENMTSNAETGGTYEDLEDDFM